MPKNTPSQSDGYLIAPGTLKQLKDNSTAFTDSPKLKRKSTVKSDSDYSYIKTKQHVYAISHQELGQGSKGRVKTVQDENGVFWAMKVFSKTTQRKGVAMEIEGIKEHVADEMYNLEFQNIEVDYAETDTKIYLFIPFAPGKNLEKILDPNNPLSFEQQLDIAIGVADALDQQFQAKGLVHHDIKPDNIHWTGTKAIIIDAGGATSASDTQLGFRQMGHPLGNPTFKPPEAATHPHRIERDRYALGLVFSSIFMNSAHSKVFNEYLKTPQNDPVKKEVQHLTSMLQDQDYRKRPAPAKVSQILQILRKPTPHQLKVLNLIQHAREKRLAGDITVEEQLKCFNSNDLNEVNKILDSCNKLKKINIAEIKDLKSLGQLYVEINQAEKSAVPENTRQELKRQVIQIAYDEAKQKFSSLLPPGEKRDQAFAQFFKEHLQEQYKSLTTQDKRNIDGILEYKKNPNFDAWFRAKDHKSDTSTYHSTLVGDSWNTYGKKEKAANDLIRKYHLSTPSPK